MSAEDHSGLQDSAKDRIPGLTALLLVYATISIPVIFSLLVGINILVWTKLRINHPFIFGECNATSKTSQSPTPRVVGLDVKSKIDYQQYTEVRRLFVLRASLLITHDKIPAILLSTLCCSFWLSFSPIGSHAATPKTWPLIWLGFNTFILCNPFPVFHRSSRVWLFKKFASLIISGVKRVEVCLRHWLIVVAWAHRVALSSLISGWGLSTFLDDFPRFLPMLTFSFQHPPRDQLCSLSFSLTNIYFIGCIYRYQFGPNWDYHCSTETPQWVVHFLLAGAPYFCRLVQSIRRWYDTRSTTHLINVSGSYLSDISIQLTPDLQGGKYASGMLMYWFYYLWRHHGNSKGTFFALYVVFATIYSIYACGWVGTAFMFTSGFNLDIEQDFLADWSTLRIHAKYPLLRDEVLCTDHLPVSEYQKFAWQSI